MSSSLAASTILVVSFFVFGAGAKVTRGVVVSHRDAYGICLDGELEESPQVDESAGYATVRDTLSVDYLATTIQVDRQKFLTREVVDLSVDAFVKVQTVFYQKIFSVGFFGRETTTQFEGGDEGDGFCVTNAMKLLEIRYFHLN